MKAFQSWWVRATALSVVLTAFVLWACEVESEGTDAGDTGPDTTTPRDIGPTDSLPTDSRPSTDTARPPDTSTGSPGVAGTDPAGDQTCDPGYDKLDIVGANCGRQADGTHLISVLFGDGVTPTLGLYYSWFLRLSVLDEDGSAIGTATVQEHDGTPGEFFEGALSASNTTITSGDGITMAFSDDAVVGGYTFFLESGVLETSSETICEERAPDTGTWTVCSDLISSP